MRPSKINRVGRNFFTAWVLSAAVPIGAIASDSNECITAKIEFIIGGQAETVAKPKCFVSSFSETVNSKNLKLIKPDRAQSGLASKVNLNDKKTVEDRNTILNSELRKAVSQKEDLSKKKSSGQAVDDMQLNRLDADIAALKNELAR